MITNKYSVFNSSIWVAILVTIRNTLVFVLLSLNMGPQAISPTSHLKALCQFTQWPFAHNFYTKMIQINSIVCKGTSAKTGYIIFDAHHYFHYWFPWRYNIYACLYGAANQHWFSIQDNWLSHLSIEKSEKYLYHSLEHTGDKHTGLVKQHCLGMLFPKQWED